MVSEWREKIIDLIKRNRVSTTEIADCMGKQGLFKGAKPILQGNYKVGPVKWVYAYNSSNYTVHEQILDMNEGDIVMIEAFNCEDRAIIGDLVSKYILIYRQAEAIVSNAPFRDARSLLKERYPIWCDGFTPVGCFNKKPDEELDKEIVDEHFGYYDGAIAVCDDSGVVIIPKDLINEDFYKKIEEIEKQEDIWFDCLDRLKWNTFDIVCKKRYLTEKE